MSLLFVVFVSVTCTWLTVQSITRVSGYMQHPMSGGLNVFRNSHNVCLYRYEEDKELFAADARLIFSNCAYYNEDDSEVGGVRVMVLLLCLPF